MTVVNQDDKAAPVVAADLDLIDDKLADGTKDDSELWNEIAAADKPKDPSSAVQAAADSDAPVESDNGAEKPEGAVEAAAGKDGTAETDKPDIWASAPPELKAAYDELAAKTAKIENDFKSANGRVSTYQRRYEDLVKAAQPVKKEETVAPTQAIEGLMQDFPEIAGPLKQALETIQGKLDNLDKAEESRRVAAQTELVTMVEEQTKRLDEAIPDWETTLKANGAAFAAWVEDQPRRIREIAYREDITNADEAAEVVKLFKAHLGQPADKPAPQADTTTKTQTQPLSDKRERQLAGTASPNPQGGRPVVSGIPEDGDPEQIWKGFAALEQQRARA